MERPSQQSMRGSPGQHASTMEWFEVRDAHIDYGGVHAVRGVSLTLKPGELVAVIGPNGAGKTSLIRAISGLVPLSSGEILFEGSRIHRLRPHQIVPLGIAQVPEGRHLFPAMSTRENLDLGGFLSPRAAMREERLAVEELFPILRARSRQRAGRLSGGEQQMLAIGRALMARPRLLLLDEPSVGLAPKVVQAMAETIAEIAQRMQIGILFVEQNARVALRVCTRGYVLELGRVVLSGTTDELAADESVRRAYLTA